MLTVEHISKAFHRKPILRDISFSVQEGETVGIVGKNGAGKTTLLRILAKISFADKGDVKVRNDSIFKGAASVHAKILYLGHYPNLYPVLTAVENLSLVSRLYGVKVNQERILEILGRLELLPQRWDPIRYFSRGMLQRLALAKALLVPWDILLFDEPTTSLDESGLEMLEDFLRQKRQEEKTLIVVSHQKEWLKNFCSRLLMLQDGIIVEIREDS